eukprot:Em0006g15a
MDYVLATILALMVSLLASHEGHAQNLTCDTSITQPLCPGAVVSCTCVVSGTSSLTRWVFTTTNPCLSKSNLISLAQPSPCAPPTGSSQDICGAYLSAANNNPMVPTSPCQVSTLNITANPSLNGLVLECRDLATLVGTRNVSIVGLPGMPGVPQVSLVCTNSLTIQWTPASSGFNASSYNISVGNGTSTLATTSTNATIGDLIDGTNYTVSVTAINCAGSSNSNSVSVQTLPCAPVSVNVTTVLYQNNSVYDVELFWTHRQQSCSVPQYTVMVTSATSTDVSAVNVSYCTSSSCSYVQSISGANVSSYNVSVACRNTLNQIGQPYVAMQSVPTPVLQVGQSNVSGNTATIPCTFLDGSSHYCMVCCSPSVPVGLAGSGYLSSTSGPNVSVSLQGLTSGQMYYCKAAATNTNSNNCAGPVVGGVKVFFSFISNYSTSPSSSASRSVTSSPVPTLAPKPDTGFLNGGQIAGIVVGVVVGILILVAVVVVVVVMVMFLCIRPQKYSPSKEQTDAGEMRDILNKESSATPERVLEGHEVYDTLSKKETTPTDDTSTFKEPAKTEGPKYADLQPLAPVNIEIRAEPAAPSVQYSGVVV